MLDSVLPPMGAAKAAPRAPAPTAEKPKSAPVQKSKSGAASPKKPKSAGPDITDRAMGILAEEIGVEVSELSPQTEFNDMGVDSLLSLTISGKFREELDIEVESSIFVECPSVKDLKQYFSENHSGASSVLLTPENSGSDTEVESLTTVDDEEERTDAKDGPINDGAMTKVREIIAEEVGVSIAEIQDNADLSQLGMDSLMALTVTGRLREELPDAPEIPGDFFAQNNSLLAIEDTLGLKPKPVKAAPVKATKQTSPPVQKAPSPNTTPAASSILLQGNPKTAAKTLWLFPDGSGSATSYGPLGRVGSDIAVYGLNCPYMKTPQDLQCSLEGVTPPYLTEIRRRQPSGPYYFGGWSAGGISAFDAAQQLIAQGETVERLIFLDSPFPIGLEKLPPRLYDFFKSIGMFGTDKQGPPDWLIGHFLAFVDSLDKYRAQPFAAGKAPKTHMIWAVDGVCKFPDSPRPEPRKDDPKEMRWLLENRSDFGPNGWDRLLNGKENLVVETLEGANHFSMMEGEKANKLAQFISRGMA